MPHPFEPLRRFARAGFAAAVALTTLAPTPSFADDPSGSWHGRLGVGLRLVLHLSQGEQGLGGTLDSPDQGASGIPLGRVELRGDSLFVEVPRIGARYVARRVSPDSLAGEWRQGGADLPLAFGRGEMERPRRPQEPQGAVPYAAREVTIDAGGDVRLAGTLTVPRGDGPHPAALLISGSGRQNRDEELFGHRPFLVLADHLTRRGIAVLRVDDRGVGGSSGDFAGATSDDFARDAHACVRWLRGQAGIDARRVGMIGHSEGAIVAPMVATRDTAVAFVVLLAGPASDGRTVLLDQLVRMRRAAGADSASMTPLVAAQRAVMDEVTRADTTALRARVHAGVRAAMEHISEFERAQIRDMDAIVESQVRQLTSPWMRFFVQYDPVPSLRALHCPTLALFGGKDLQIAPEVHRAPMERALAASRARDHDVRVLPGLNHMFQTATTGTVDEYGRIEETFAPAALDAIGSWIASRFVESARAGGR